MDAAIARGESVLAAGVLVAMILVAVAQASLRTLAGHGLEIGNELLDHIRWADPFLQKGTLWLAFLGASLATHDDKHIAIDAIPRMAPGKAQALMKGITSLVAAGVSLVLAHVFRLSVLNNAKDVPLEYSVLDAEGMAVHICDAAAQQIESAGLERPGFFCGVRALLEASGNQVAIPTHALELIVPFMLVVMALRFFAKGVYAFTPAGMEAIARRQETTSSGTWAVDAEAEAGAGEDGEEER